MILFCDTSALLKLFVQEEHTDAMQASAAAADALAVSRLSWPECMSALARRAREAPRDASALAQTRQVELAGDYAEAFALRAYDSVQLAALQTLRLQSGEEVRFACFDSRLAKAAAVLGVAGA